MAGLPNPPERHGTSQFTGVFEASSVFFQGNFYTVFWHSESQAVLVFSYNVEKNSWKEVLVELNLNPWYPQLVINSHHLFMGLWANAPLLLPPIGQDHDETMFEIKVISVNCWKQGGGANLELRHHTNVWWATLEWLTVCPYRWIPCHVPLCCAGFGFEWKTDDVWWACSTSIAMSLLAAAGGMGIWQIRWTWG